ncbi:TDA10 (YGR205W) [Zygosaccharomyces parabailii]|nr:TDA10 (YGR205W) [Zygosaccharomyces parabailii]CDH15465.1 related to ATP-dependent kinase TDA10 [Zygosaccharomyces bailii ISA1307]
MDPIVKILDFVDHYTSSYMERTANGGRQGPLFVFVTGPQGSGKTFTSKAIVEHLSKKYKVAGASIDDFYLTHEDQVKFSKTFPKNKLLQGRGLPGTHDITLLTRCVETILKGKEGFAELPNYDKSLCDGAGDRSGFRKVGLPLDVFVLEGWFLGFTPMLSRHEIDSHHLLQGGNDMVQVNANLLFYRDLLWGNPEIKSLGIVFEADDINNVYQWRLEQERVLRKTKGRGMTDEEVKKFVDRYWPCYELYYEDLIKSENLGSVATLTLGLNLQRKLFCIKDRCIE